MCFYVFVTLPDEVTEQQLAALRYPPLMLRPLGEHAIEGVPQAHRVYRATAGHCDCGSLFEVGGVDVGLETSRLEAHVRKLRNKGWGEAKIARWKSESVKTSAVTRAAADPTERNAWNGLFARLARCEAIREVGIFAHQFSGTLAEERGSLKCMTVHDLHATTADLFEAMETDRLYLLRRFRPA